MAYDKYSTEKVFSSELVNILCNKILDKVYVDFPGSQTKLVATNELAKIIQGAPVTDLKVVPFVTNDSDIYAYLVNSIAGILNVETQLSFLNRIQVVTAQCYFEIWYDVGFVASVNVNGIYCRDINELN